ncbi:WAT1-related protein At5g07050-like [Carica papaya]|uniref:WAT1-related protein At5g07050-like n=1 Tax=Carica papaya TaxID=3649 RepID=UPI000B8CCC10|nr:WAT1-related protein At5g07050-like [Carica papaya]
MDQEIGDEFRIGIMNIKKETIVEDLQPYMLCILSNILFAGYTIVSKVCLDGGMSRYVLAVYAHAFGTMATALLALLLERKQATKISLQILRNAFFNGLVGGVLARTLYFAGLEYTSATVGSAMSNLIPPITFVLAVLCRMEKIEIGSRIAQAKIWGTCISFGGATLITLYKGAVLIAPLSTHSHHIQAAAKHLTYIDWIKGSIMLFVSSLSTAFFYILQAVTVKKYPAPLTLTSLMCLFATLLGAIFTAIIDREASSWRLSWDITLLAPLYSGILVFGVTIYLQTLAVRMKGPVFITAFGPLSTLIVAIVGLFILGEALHLGDVIGAVLIVGGLYAVLWGKEKEKQKKLLLDLPTAS